jgi:ubiquinone/menaquinone biosynthesis C-methylase UbiE
VPVDFVDLSAKMIDLAERRISGMGRSARARVAFHVGDVREFAPRPAGYDLITTHFFLDCFREAELAEVIGKLAGWATPKATWIVSDFRETKGWVRRVWSKGIIRGLYAAFRVTTGLRVTQIPDYKSAIANSGFELRYKEKALGGLLHSSFWTGSFCAGNVPGAQRANR